MTTFFFAQKLFLTFHLTPSMCFWACFPQLNIFPNNILKFFSCCFVKNFSGFSGLSGTFFLSCLLAWNAIVVVSLCFIMKSNFSLAWPKLNLKILEICFLKILFSWYLRLFIPLKTTVRQQINSLIFFEWPCFWIRTAFDCVRLF